MKKEVKDLWVAALRSGEYKQGKYRLRPTLDTYCCLGVLCDVHCEVTNAGQFEGDRYVAAESIEETIPPSPVTEWAGMSRPNPTVGSYSICDPSLGGGLAGMNDDLGKSFDEIADMIEANWETM